MEDNRLMEALSQGVKMCHRPEIGGPRYERDGFR